MGLTDQFCMREKSSCQLGAVHTRGEAEAGWSAEFAASAEIEPAADIRSEPTSALQPAQQRQSVSVRRLIRVMLLPESTEQLA
jgi:hypothetical protein